MATLSNTVDDLHAQLEAAQDRWTQQQFRSFAVMCYRSIELFLSGEAKAAIDWVASDLNQQPFETPLEVVLQSLQWNVINPDAARASENLFSFEVLMLLEKPPLEAAKAAITAVSRAADLQAVYARSQTDAQADTQTNSHEAIAQFNKRLALSQIVGLLKKVETDVTSIDLFYRPAQKMLDR